jgi:hypothetical protein
VGSALWYSGRIEGEKEEIREERTKIQILDR